MLYFDFQRGMVPHNFHVCAAFFQTAGMPRSRSITAVTSIVSKETIEKIERDNRKDVNLFLNVNPR